MTTMTMTMMKKIFLLPLLIVLACSFAFSQITVGGNAKIGGAVTMGASSGGGGGGISIYQQPVFCTANISSAFTCTLGSAAPAGSKIVVAIGHPYASTITGVTFNSVTMNFDEPNSAFVGIWSLDNVSGGTQATGTCGTGGGCLVILLNFTGVATSSSLDQVGRDQTSSPTYASLTTSSLAQPSSELAIGNVMDASGNVSSDWLTVASPFSFTDSSPNWYCTQGNNGGYNYHQMVCWALTTSSSGLAFSGTTGASNSGAADIAVYKHQ